jgi:hypothetical protein
MELQREEESGGSEAKERIESITVKQDIKIKSDLTI